MIINPIVVTPSMSLNVSVDVRRIDVRTVDVPPVDVGAIDVPAVDVSPVDVGRIPSVDVSPVDVPAIDASPVDVPCRPVSNRGPGTTAASRDAGLRDAQPRAAREQNGDNYENLSHSFLLSSQRSLSSNVHLLRGYQPESWNCGDVELIRASQQPMAKLDASRLRIS